MKGFRLFLAVALLAPAVSIASEGCEYYIDHQIERFIHSVESEPTGDIEIEYYFRQESDAYKFAEELASTAKVEDDEFYGVGKRVRMKHNLKLPRFALEVWFASHYQVVCSNNGYINGWATPT